MTVRTVTNCDAVELSLNGQSLGRHTVSHNVYSSDWNVPYAPGTLSAVGYRAGKEVATNKLSTTGAAAKLQIAPAGPNPWMPVFQFSAIGDVALYEITVVDAADQTVQDAALPVTVRVEDGCRLIGLDSGELSYEGLFKTDTRNAYQGRLLATVQRTSAGGWSPPYGLGAGPADGHVSLAGAPARSQVVCFSSSIPNNPVSLPQGLRQRNIPARHGFRGENHGALGRTCHTGGGLLLVVGPGPVAEL